MSIQTYSDSLFDSSPSLPSDRRNAAQRNDQQAWDQLIENWEKDHGPNATPGPGPSSLAGSFDQDLLTRNPWPNLLDYLDPDQPGANGHAKQARQSKQAMSPVIPQTPEIGGGQPGSVPLSREGSSTLPDRIRSHLQAPSAYTSLISLLASPRSNEDIQLELVEILGFEGDGLRLVEDVLRPGARDTVVGDRGAGINGHGTQLSKRGKKSAPSGSRTPAYLPSSRLTLNATKGKAHKQALDLHDVIGSSEDIERRIQEQLDRPKALFSEDGPRIVEQEALPHVYTTSAVSSSSSMGGKLALPHGTQRQMNDTFEEVVIPPSRALPPKKTERPVRIADLPPLAKGCFPNYVTLNRMQSIVQPTAIDTNENMLICAPTGAGKTDVAIMAIIRILVQHLKDGPSTHPSGFSINRDAFKVIYVAPMKALAAEITRKFGKRLAWLGIKVRELTGDMQMTRQEIAETQIIVTTPEKWDVVTRKPSGEGELASKVKLLIIDEVHLLNEERGAVIETIVARTLRQVESSQSLIRIVGLSATLPNYIDVSDFLRVNRYQGLFFFDASFRPVPLEQHFIGVAGRPRSQASTRNMDQVVFEKVSEMVREGHQVMVFVHARKETVKSAQRLLEMAKEEGMTAYFDTREHPKNAFYRRDISTSRNKEMRELFDAGFGIHHAGMLRSDRNMMERMFEDNAIKVLCCTSTLAWGVNLPAHAVVIKGTQVYDSSKGSFVDLSVLDVLQLDHYLYSIMAQHPIESKFIPGMVDALNAEISLGTIANVQEAIQWLGYTYLFVRMRKEPFIYGMPHDELKDDPQLGNKRNQLIVQAARQLSSAKMIRFDEISNSFIISDLGRIAAKYYLRHQTIEVFSGMFHPKMRNADLFAMLSQATEFEQIQLRESEMDELNSILESDHCPMQVKGGTASKHGKVNVLLQAHISRVYIEDFALVSDAAYVAQNAARIIRALLEIALSRLWANCAILLIDLSKAIERRLWPYEHPLAQLSSLHRDTLYNLRQWADDAEIVDLRNADPKTLAELVHLNETHGIAIRNAAAAFPLVKTVHALRPLSHDLLQISVHIEADFEWDAKLSGTAEPFYVWVEDEEGLNILQWRSVLLRPSTASLDVDFVIPVTDTIPPSYTILSASDRWIGSDGRTTVTLGHLKMPSAFQDTTPLLDIPFLKISCFDDTQLTATYRTYITSLNSIQSQAFWTLYHTHSNALVSAPVASGKSFLGEAAIWHTFRHDHNAVVMIIVPHRHSVQECVARMRSVCPREKGISVRQLLGPTDFEHAITSRCAIVVSTPSALLRLEQKAFSSFSRSVALVVLEDLHLLDDQYELAAARVLAVVRPARTRVVGITSSVTDPSDLAAWLGVDIASRYCFQPRDRGNPIIVSMKAFTIPHSSTLQKAMIKPTYDVLRASASGAIVFAPSRSACRIISTELVTQSGTEMDMNGFLNASREEVEPMLQRLRDQSLFEPILHGIGFILSGMAPGDLSLVLELFASGILRALIVPREACWTLPVRAETVIVMGAQYTQMSGSRDKGDRQIVSYSRQELIKMQSFAAPATLSITPGARMFVMCQSDQTSMISRGLNEGLPLESTMPALFHRKGSPEAMEGLQRMLPPRPAPLPPQLNRPRARDLRKRDMMDLLQWTYFAHRIKSNPTYYDVQPGHESEDVSRLVDQWWTGTIDEFSPVPKIERKSGNGSTRSGSVSVTGETWTSTAVTETESVVEDGHVNGHVNGQLNGTGHAEGDREEDGGIEVTSEVNGVAKVGEADGERL